MIYYYIRKEQYINYKKELKYYCNNNKIYNIFLSIIYVCNSKIILPNKKKKKNVY